MSDFINGGGSISHEAATKINRLILKVEGLEKQVADLQHGRTPRQEKCKTLGEIAFQAFDLPCNFGKGWNASAKAVAEAIIERHLEGLNNLAAAIRREFEE